MGPITPFQSGAPQRFLGFAMAMQNRSLERLSTGFRINRGADDPAGLIASENLRAQLADLDAQSTALTRTEHLASTADAALGEIGDLLVQASGLAVSAANTAGLSDAEKDAYQMQMDSTLQSVQRIASTSEFNGTKLLDGSFSMSVGDASVSIGSADPSNMGKGTDGSGNAYTLSGVGSGGSISLFTGNLEFAQKSIRDALTQVSTTQGRLGAFVKNTVEPAWNSTRVAYENTAAANSMIRDADYGAEMSNLIRGGILAGASMGAMRADRTRAASILTLLG